MYNYSYRDYVAPSYNSHPNRCKDDRVPAVIELVPITLKPPQLDRSVREKLHEKAQGRPGMNIPMGGRFGSDTEAPVQHTPHPEGTSTVVRAHESSSTNYTTSSKALLQHKANNSTCTHAHEWSNCRQTTTARRSYTLCWNYRSHQRYSRLLHTNSAPTR